MSLKPHVRAAVTFTVLMFLLVPLLIGALGANIGPVELMIWLVIYVIGLGLCLLGGRSSKSRSRSAD